MRGVHRYRGAPATASAKTLASEEATLRWPRLVSIIDIVSTQGRKGNTDADFVASLLMLRR